MAVPPSTALAQRGAPPPQGPPQWLNADTSKKVNQSNFRSIEDWPTPNEYRTGSGSPGPRYWQQQIDYVIRTSLDTVRQRVSGSERMTYHNNAPEPLGYIWLQLDQDIDKTDSRAALSTAALTAPVSGRARAFLFPELEANVEPGIHDHPRAARGRHRQEDQRRHVPQRHADAHRPRRAARDWQDGGDRDRLVVSRARSEPQRTQWPGEAAGRLAV